MSDVIVTEPIYLQLSHALRERVLAGQIAVGDRFPTERQISAEYGVSRPTANKAISSLVAEGVLESRRGLGTFVRARPMDYDLKALVSFTGKARAAGKQPGTRLIDFRTLETAECDADARDRLQLGDEAVHRMERLRLADGVPVILERRFVTARHCPELNESDLSGSLYEVWTEQYGLEIAGADQTIRAIVIADADARVLEVTPGTAGFLVTSTGYLQSREPLWWERTVYRGDAYEFQNQLGPIQPTGPTGVVLTERNDRR